MKALTNILTQLLMLLLLMLVACTEDAAEVDDLVRGEEYVQVRMQVPGMKNATTRADEAEDNLTSVWALVFRDGKLVSKTEVTTAASTLIPSTSTTGTFNLSRPKVNDVIHFLGNVPNGVTLPDVGDDESALCNLETGDRENLSYWGKATYTGTDITVNLYRHLAKIEIAPDPNECTFPEDELFIAGLVNANTKGKLVPYDDENGAFNFDLSDENYGGNYDYCTVPAEPNPLEETPLLDNNGAGFKNWLYVFEHENPETADGLYVICKIGKYYYKVALTSDGETPYDIIRNHKYTILVKDLDEVVYNIPDNITEEKEIENYKYQQALKSDPINLEIKVEKEVALQLIQEGIDENGDELKIQQGNIDINSHANSTEEVTIKVVVPAGVKTLTVQAEGFTVTSGDAGDGREMTSDGNNQYTIKEAYRNQENIVRFKLKLNNDVDAETETTITVSGEGEDQYTTVTANASTTITVTPAGETEGTIWWQGLMILDAMDDETKIAIPKSYFFNGETPLIPVGSQIVFDFENVTGFLSDTDDDYLRIWMQAADPNDWSQVATQDFVYDDNRATLNVTQEVLDDILDTSDGEYANDNALIIQGQGRILKKITLIPAKERIDAEPDKTQLYYDSDDTQVVTVNVTVPDGVERLNIGGAEKFAIAKTAGNGTLDGTTYTMGSERTATFTFTLNAQNVISQQTITFSDPSETVNAASVSITMAPTPTVTFTNTGSQTIRLNGTPLSVTMDVPEGKTLSDFSITVTPATGLNVAQGENQLTLTEGVYTTTSGVSDEQTFTFTPTIVGTYTITFSGEGTDVNMPDENNRTINLTVGAAAVTGMSVTAVKGDSTIDLDSGDTNVTFTLTKPSSVGQLNIGVKDANSTNVKNNFSITADGQSPWNNNDNQDDGYYYNVNNNSETVTITVALKNGFDTAGTYTITISDYNKTMSATATITIKKTPTVSFSNTGDKTLYWNDGSPTSFDVEMTVPIDGSVTLSINAAAFTVTKSSESSGTLSGPSNGVYTYTGGNTTFTITPASAESVNANPHTIRITGTGEGVIVPDTPIKVTVGETAPSEIVLWGNGEGEDYDIDYNAGKTLEEITNLSTISQYYSVDNTIIVYFKVTNSNRSSETKLQFITGNYGSLSNEYKFSGEGETSCSLLLTSENLAQINSNNGIKLLCTNVTITKISYIPKQTP